MPWREFRRLPTQIRFIDLTVSGQKKQEIRVNDRQVQNIKVGDVICLYNTRGSVNIRITQRQDFKSFKELLGAVKDFNLLAPGANRRYVYSVLRALYTEDREKQYGAVLLDFELA